MDIYEQALQDELAGEFRATTEGFFGKIGQDITIRNDPKRGPYRTYKGKRLSLEEYLKRRLGKSSNDKQKEGKHSFTADFESLHEKWSIKEGRTRVWAWGLTNVYNPNHHLFGNNLDEFMNLLKKLYHATLYFHNLKFDGYFVLEYFYDRKIPLAKTKEEIKENTYTCFVVNAEIYSITWYLDWNKSQKRWNTITFYDSYRILPRSIKVLGKTFKDVLKMGKVDVDEEFYTRYRSVNHDLTDEEKIYLRQDCEISATAIKYMLDNGHDRMTLAGNAMQDYRRRSKENPFTDENGRTRTFKELFPKLPLGNEHDDNGNGWNSWIRKAYKGGYTYTPERYKGQTVGRGLVYDVNSLFPSVMLSELLPWGEPIWFDGNYYETVSEHKRKRYPLFIMKVRLGIRLKKGHLPTLAKPTMARKYAEYWINTDKPRTFYLTNKDLELVKEHYHIDKEEYFGGYRFKGYVGMFKDYIEYWNGVKENAKDEGMRFISKLFLNALYGKFATRWDRPNSFPFHKKVWSEDEHGKAKRVEIVAFEKEKKWDDMSEKEQEEMYKNSAVYYPAVAAFITAAARYITIKAGQANYKRVCHIDTDSLHLRGRKPAKEIEIDNKKIGFWKLEAKFKGARFLRPKCYIEEYTNGINKETGKMESRKIHVKVSGMHANCHEFVTFDSFYEWDFTLAPGAKGLHPGNLRPKIFPGGVLITKDYHEIRPR